MTSRVHQMKWAMVAAVVAGLALPAIASAAHLAGFAHANPIPGGGSTSTLCDIDSYCLLVQNNNAGGDSATGLTGVHGSSSGAAAGVRGSTNSSSLLAKGVEGVVNPTSAGAASAGVWGENNSTSVSGTGVRGEHHGGGIGVHGTSVNGNGVSGTHTNSSTHGFGVRGTSNSPYPSAGVAGFNGGNGIGVYGESLSGFAISGFSPNNWAGYFHGAVNVNGNLTKNSGAFRIDHPLDPENKYLQHSFVESPDMMNVYNGNVRTDRRGFATVKLPRYFSALNRDFRYQLTTIGRHADAWIAKEIANNRFSVRTEKPFVKVSWQVTGIRKDAWANTHRIKVEETKTGSEAGKYLNPELYGKPATKSVVVLPGMKRADNR